MNNLQIIAHRGASGNCGDNNIISIKKAIEIGCSIIEIDIRLTSDNILVLYHDSEITINNKKYIIEKSIYNDVSEKVCTLEKILEISPKNLLYYLDIKVLDNKKKFTKYLVSFLKKYTNRTFILASFDKTFIGNFPLLNNIKFGIISEKYDPEEINSYLSKISYLILDINYIQNLDIKKIKNYLCNKKIYLYTVNIKNELLPYLDLIDGIVTDYPNEFLIKA